MDVILTGVVGGLGSIGAYLGLRRVLGERIEKQWEYEVAFCDVRGRAFGEFGIELRRIVGEPGDFRLHATFELGHPTLQLGQSVEVFLEDTLVMHGPVETEGRVRFRNEHLCDDLKDPRAGQICSVRIDGVEFLADRLRCD